MFRLRSVRAFPLVALSLCLPLLMAVPVTYAQTPIPAANRITAADAAETSGFGYSVALSGSTALVGAILDSVGGSLQGSAYLFDAAGTQTQKLTAADGEDMDFFGSSVALSGNTALVGAVYADNGGASDQGAAYLFSAATGAQIAKLVADDGAANDNFGVSVSLSGNRALVGSFGSTIGANSFQGAAYLFDFDADAATQTRKLFAADGLTDSNFGASVALSGSTALIGASGDTIDGKTDQGSAYLFDADTGALLRKLSATDGAVSDYFGSSVALSGNFALVGAYNSAVGGNLGQGAAYLFDITTGDQLFKFTALNGAASDLFGFSVALSGNLALIGAYGTTVGGNEGQGAVYAFDVSTGQQIARYVAEDGTVGDVLGYSVALGGTTALTGAFLDAAPSTQQGSAYRFTVSAADATAAPEPGSLALLLPAAMGALGRVARRRRTGAARA